MIRNIRQEDAGAFADLMMEFYHERVNQCGYVMDRDECVKQFITYSTFPGVFGLVNEDNGIIDGVIIVSISSMIGSKEIFGQEIVWYVKREKRSVGVRLLKSMEKLLKDEGCDGILMIGLEGDKSCDIYPAFGYKTIQRTFMKRLV